MIIDFLDTKLSKPKLKAALEVLRAFKANESEDEWYTTPFQAWVKLEQLEEYLDHLVNSAPLAPDTIAFMKENPKEN